MLSNKYKINLIASALLLASPLTSVEAYTLYVNSSVSSTNEAIDGAQYFDPV